MINNKKGNTNNKAIKALTSAVVASVTAPKGKATKGNPLAPKGVKTNSQKITDLVTALTAPSAPAPAPVVTPISAPAPAPSAPSAPVMGEVNLTSKRVTLAMDQIKAYRIANNQRKGVTAKYYVQGGRTVIDPLNQRERFSVALEIPYTDLHQAKLKLVELRATLEVKKSA